MLWAVALTTVAQDNFKLTGKIDGADSDTLCIEYVILQPEKQIVKRKVAVEKGEFSFSAELHEAYAGSMFLKSNPKETLYTYFVPDEEAIFSGRLNSAEEHWGGTTFYQQYERVGNVQHPFSQHPLTNKTEVVSRYVQKEISQHYRDYGNMITLKFSYRLDYGRRYRDIQRTMNHRDNETGILQSK